MCAPYFSWIVRNPHIIPQLYASILALTAVSTPPRIANVANTHLVWVLLGTWIVYVYRDVYPLGTFTLKPLDLHEGWLMWAKFGVLTFAALTVPSFIPTQYVPFDPKVCPAPLSWSPPLLLTSASHRTQQRILILSKQPPGSRSFSSFSWVASSPRHLAFPTFPLKNSHLFLIAIGHPILLRRVFPYVLTRRADATFGSHLNRP